MAKPARRLDRRLIIGGLVVLIAIWIVAQYFSFERTEKRYYRQLLLISDIEVVDLRLGTADDHDTLESELERIVNARILDISACLRTENDTIAPAVMDLAIEGGEVLRSQYRSRSATLEDDHVTCLDAAMTTVGWPSSSIEFVVLLDRRTLVNVMTRQFPWLRQRLRPNPH